MVIRAPTATGLSKGMMLKSKKRKLPKVIWSSKPAYWSHDYSNNQHPVAEGHLHIHLQEDILEVGGHGHNVDTAVSIEGDGDAHGGKMSGGKLIYTKRVQK